MATVVSEVLTYKEAASRRDALLSTIVDRDTFFHRAEVFDLTPDEQAMFDDLNDLNYLLGDE